MPDDKGLQLHLSHGVVRKRSGALQEAHLCLVSNQNQDQLRTVRVQLIATSSLKTNLAQCFCAYSLSKLTELTDDLLRLLL